MSDKTHTRRVTRVRRKEVITVTIPAIVLTIDTELRDGKLHVGVSAPPWVVIGDPTRTVEQSRVTDELF